MPLNPTGLSRNIKQTTGSGLPPNRRPQAPGLGATGPLNLAGPPKMPSAMNGVNTSKPMGGMGLGGPVAPPMGGGPMGMPVAPDGQTGMPQLAPPSMVAPPMDRPGETVGFGGGRFGTDMLIAQPGPGTTPLSMAGGMGGPPGYRGRLPPMNMNQFGGMTRGRFR